MTDGVIKVQPDSTGKSVDASELTRADTTVVERQRVAVADNEDPGAGGVAAVRDRQLQVEDRTLHVLEEMNETLKAIRFALEALGG